METFLLSVLLTAAGHASPENCTDLRNTFSEYRTAVSQGTEAGRYFSRSYLEGQVDSLLVDGDEAILHNAKATRMRILIAPAARSDYQVAAQCSTSSGSITLSFPTGRPRSLRLGYVLEDGAWRIDMLEINLGSTAADGT